MAAKHCRGRKKGEGVVFAEKRARQKGGGAKASLSPFPEMGLASILLNATGSRLLLVANLREKGWDVVSVGPTARFRPQRAGRREDSAQYGAHATTHYNMHCIDYRAYPTVRGG